MNPTQRLILRLLLAIFRRMAKGDDLEAQRLICQAEYHLDHN